MERLFTDSNGASMTVENFLHHSTAGDEDEDGKRRMNDELTEKLHEHLAASDIFRQGITRAQHK